MRSFFYFYYVHLIMVTLKELAKLLNISVSTASKALNDSSEIGEKTKKRVLELAEELNYRPNRIAQQLKSNTTKTIGVILPTVINPFFAEVLHGIETTAAKNKYDIIVCLSNEIYLKEKRSLDLLANGSVDGFILTVARESQVQNESRHLQSILDNNVPIVMFDRVVKDIVCDKVIVDDYQSVYDATQHLIQEEKRKNVVLLSNIEELSVGQYRINGYTDVIKGNGLEPKVLKLANEQNPEDYIYKYLEDNPNVDAMISIDHITGIIALNMCKKLGITVPKDISIIGFGYENTSLLSSPKISVIHQKAHNIGKMSMDILLERLKNKEKRIKTIIVPSELKLNESTL